MNNHLQCHGLI